MKKLILSLALTGSLFAATQSSDKVVINDNASKIEAQQSINAQQSIVNDQQAEINNQQEKINFAQIDTNIINRQMLNDLGNKVRSDNDLVESYRYKIRNLESTIEKQQSTINKLDSRLYTIERKVKWKIAD